MSDGANLNNIESLMRQITAGSSKDPMDEVQSQKKRIEDSIRDEYSNPNLSLGEGGNKNVEQLTKYGLTNDTLNFTLWVTLYNDNALFRRGIDVPAQDIVQHGFNLKGLDDATLVDLINSRYNEDMDELTELATWGALFGGAIAVVMFEDVKLEDMVKPRSSFKKQIQKKDGVIKLYVTDRWYNLAPSTKTVTDIKSIDYGKPVAYKITFDDGKEYTIHHSWVLRYEHRKAPRFIRPMLSGWGYAEGSHIFNELKRFDKLNSSITSLIDKSLIEVIKMKGMRGLFMGTDPKTMEQIEKRLKMVNWGRNFNSLTFLDKDDEYSQFTNSSLAGLADLFESELYLVCMAFEIPKFKLVGETKGGLSNNDKLSLEIYDSTIQNKKNSYWRPVLTKYLEIMFDVYGIDKKIDFDFNSIITRTEEDRWDNLAKIATALSTMITDGYVTPQIAAKIVKQYFNQLGIDSYDEAFISSLDDTIKEEMEDIDLSEEEEKSSQEVLDSILDEVVPINKMLPNDIRKKYPNIALGFYPYKPKGMEAMGSIYLRDMRATHDISKKIRFYKPDEEHDKNKVIRRADMNVGLSVQVNSDNLKGAVQEVISWMRSNPSRMKDYE